MRQPWSRGLKTEGVRYVGKGFPGGGNSQGKGPEEDVCLRVGRCPQDAPCGARRCVSRRKGGWQLRGQEGKIRRLVLEMLN